MATIVLRLKCGFARRTGTRYQRRIEREIVDQGACQSFGSLKTEEKTERQCGQFMTTFGRSRNCLSILLSATLPAATRIQAVFTCVREGRPNQQGRIVHMSFGSDDALADKSL